MMKKRFNILISILLLVSIGLIFFNTSSSKDVKEANSKLQLKVQALQQEQQELQKTKEELLSQKKLLEDKLNK